MKPVIRQFCTMMAASDIDERKIKEILNFVAKMPLQSLLVEIASIRREFNDGSRYVELEVQEVADQITERVIDLLVFEANLPKSEARRLLVSTLQISYPDRHVPAFNSKTGFPAWIKSLKRNYTDSEILHAATRLRNEHVHRLEKRDDWLHRNVQK